MNRFSSMRCCGLNFQIILTDEPGEDQRSTHKCCTGSVHIKVGYITEKKNFFFSYSIDANFLCSSYANLFSAIYICTYLCIFTNSYVINYICLYISMSYYNTQHPHLFKKNQHLML